MLKFSIGNSEYWRRDCCQSFTTLATTGARVTRVLILYEDGSASETLHQFLILNSEGLVDEGIIAIIGQANLFIQT